MRFKNLVFLRFEVGGKDDKGKGVGAGNKGSRLQFLFVISDAVVIVLRAASPLCPNQTHHLLFPLILIFFIYSQTKSEAKIYEIKKQYRQDNIIISQIEYRKYGFIQLATDKSLTMCLISQCSLVNAF